MTYLDFFNFGVFECFWNDFSIQHFFLCQTLKDWVLNSRQIVFCIRLFLASTLLASHIRPINKLCNLAQVHNTVFTTCLIDMAASETSMTSKALFPQKTSWFWWFHPICISIYFYIYLYIYSFLYLLIFIFLFIYSFIYIHFFSYILLLYIY